MGFRFQKRINLGGGLGFNISKSGISPSLRTKAGTISSKRLSIRTGITGVTYQKNLNESKNGGCLLLFVFSGILFFLLKTL